MAAVARESQRPRPVRGRDTRTLRTLVLVGSGTYPAEAEMRRLIAEDAMPDSLAADEAIGGTLLDHHYLSRMPGLRGRIFRKLPRVVAQTAEVFLRGNDYDAVVTWSERIAFPVAASMWFRRRRPAHIAILIWPSKLKKAALMRFVHHRMDRMVVFAPLQRKFVEDRFGTPPHRFVDVRWPVDTAFWRPMPGAEDMICSVGQEMRDYETLVAALRPLKLRCHIAAGTGAFNVSSAKWWGQALDSEKLPVTVTVGAKSFLQLRELYARSRFAVVPLLPSDSDNGVTTILEAFAMGKAVICTETAGQVGVLENGVNCLRVPPRDPAALRAAIEELWNDPEKCRRFGAAGRAVVLERHGPEQWISGLVTAVGEAAAKRGPSS